MKYLKGFAIITGLVALMYNSVYARGYNEMSYEEIDALERTFNAADSFKDYKSFENIYQDHYYAVENYNENNNKAVFFFDNQQTDFIYNSISDIRDDMCIVSEVKDGTEYFALYDMDFEKEILPFEYKNIEFMSDGKGRFYVVKVTDFNDDENYYISKKEYEEGIRLGDISENEIPTEDAGLLLKVSSDILIPPEPSEPTYTPIKGLEEYSICCQDPDSDSYLSSNYYIVDANGKKVSDEYLGISPSAEDGFIEVSKRSGMTGYLRGALNTELKEIIPIYYTEIIPIKHNGHMLIRASYYTPDYYTLEGEIIPEDEVDDYLGLGDIVCSDWAKESTKEAIKEGIVPTQLQGEYTKNISREEFCALAMQTYFVIKGSSLDGFLSDEQVGKPFTDTDSPYVAAAYSLGIVNGTGEGKFSPESFITRQESAVMLTNLIKKALGEGGIVPKKERFVDEGYFADWAKDSIYYICGDRVSGLNIMQGTGSDKFSPWMNYSREQAIATMYRVLH